MEKEINYTGTCIPEKHYMADTSGKLEEIIKLVEKDFLRGETKNVVITSTG